jgi:hypothetical protein
MLSRMGPANPMTSTPRRSRASASRSPRRSVLVALALGAGAVTVVRPRATTAIAA